MPAIESKRFSHTQVLTIDGTIDQVFPLFGPIREREWTQGWNPLLIHSDSDLGDSAGTIFITEHPSGSQATWYVNRFDPVTHSIEYLRSVPAVEFTQIVITCQPEGDHKTHVTVTYTFTALSEQGATQLDRLALHHPESVQQWQEDINRSLKTR